MKNSYKPIGDYIRVVNEKNKDLSVTQLIGLSIDKCYIPSVANIIGTDLSSYKVIRKNQFACSLMQVSRDGKIPIACMTDYDEAIMSPAYVIFEIADDTLVSPDYLNMWFMRSEFDREASFLAVGGVRGSLTWDDFCRMKFPLIPIDEQNKVVRVYKAITDRINLKKRINDNLFSQAKTYFSLIFSDRDVEKPLPQGWKVAKVGDYCIDNIANLSKADTFENILYLDTSSITSNYIIELQELNLFTDEIPSRAKRKATNGDIIYSTVRPNLKHYGLLQNPPENLIVSTGFAVLHNKKLGVTNEFLFMWLTNESTLDYLQAIAENSVSTYPSLNVSDLMNVKIIVPEMNILKKQHAF